MIHGGRAARLLESGMRRLADAGGLIVDLGTPQRFHKEMRPFESLFAGKTYRAYGYHPCQDFGVYNCDGHQDIEALSFEDRSIDGVICLDVLEHVQDPFSAAREICRVLRPGGQLVLTVPFLTSFHGKDGSEQGHDSYPDFWRMTHSGLALLFKSLTSVDVIPLDGPLETRLNQLRLGPLLSLSPFRGLVDAMDRPTCGKATSRHLLLGRK